MDIRAVGILKLQQGHEKVAKHEVSKKKTLSTIQH